MDCRAFKKYSYFKKIPSKRFLKSEKTFYAWVNANSLWKQFLTLCILIKHPHKLGSNAVVLKLFVSLATFVLQKPFAGHKN